MNYLNCLSGKNREIEMEIDRRPVNVKTILLDIKGEFDLGHEINTLISDISNILK